jgi:hypothetical protein
MPSHRKTHRKPHAPAAGADKAAEAADAIRKWLLAAMTALLVARPLFPSEAAADHGDGLTVVMLWLALAMVWLVGAVGRKRLAFRFGPVDAAVLCLVAWQCVAALHAVYYGSPRPAWNMLWEWVGLGMIFLAARQLLDDAREVRAIVAVMIALMAAISVYGIYQTAIELPAQQRKFAEDPEGMFREAGLSLPPGDPMRDLLAKRMANREPTATFALSNSLAAALAPWLVVGLGIAAARRDRRRWIAWPIALPPIAVCLLLTKSRSGYVAAVVGILWLAFGVRRLGHPATPRSRAALQRAIAAAVAVLALLAAVTIAGFARPALAKAAATSFGYRLQYWQATLRMIADRPLVGCGPGNFQDVYTQYKLPEASEEVADPHDFLLEVWATGGTPALLALLAAVGLFAIGTRTACRERPPWRSVWMIFRASTERHGGRSLQDAPSQDGGLKPTLQDAPPHDWKFILIGAIGGFLLSIFLGLLSTAPSSNMAFAIGLPVAVASLALLFPWIRDGTFPPSLAGVGAAVLLVDLLTTGGIGYPAVAQSLWLFLALGLNAAVPRNGADAKRHGSRRVGLALLALVFGLLLACYQTSYARVLPCQNSLWLARREFNRDRQAAFEAAQKAVAADPLSSPAHALLAEIYLDSWLATLNPADYHAFETDDALARRMAPESIPIWRPSAERYRRAYAVTDSRGRHVQPRAIEQAMEIARRAVQLYPGSGSDRARLAIIYQLFGDEAAYRREAQEALELDRHIPHEDKKLPADLRRKLEAAVEGL